MMNFNDYKKQVGLTVKQMFTPKISDRYGATRVSSAKHRTGTTHIVLHTTANTAPARNEALNIKNNAGINSFHAVVDKDEVYETVRFQNVAHHAGHKGHNCSSLGFELVQKDMEAGYKNLVKYVGYVMAQLNLKPSHKTIQYHHDIVRTSCGGFYKEKGKDNVLKDITHYYNIAKSGSTEKAPKPQAKPKPSKPKNKKVTEKVVNDVILGKYGNGADRKKNLEKAGYNYEEVQDAVNRSYGAKPKAKPKPKPKPKPKNKKVTSKLVDDVILGKYGNGSERKKRLEKAGYNYSEVQRAVNERFGAKTKAKPKKNTSTIKKGDTVTSNARKDIFGTSLDRSMFDGKKRYKVIQVGRNGNKNHILLDGVMTWVDKSKVKKV